MHVYSVCPCFMPMSPRCMFMSHVFAVPCSVSILHVHAACLCYISMLQVHSAYSCCMPMLRAHASCPCLQAACPCCMFISLGNIIILLGKMWFLIGIAPDCCPAAAGSNPASPNSTGDCHSLAGCHLRRYFAAG